MRRPWADFANVRSESHVRELVSAASDVLSSALVDMAHYRVDERIAACGSVDPLLIRLAYAQDEWVYDATGQIITAPADVYQRTSREERVNKFGLAYRRDARFWLHKPLADIVIGAAIYLYQSQGWRTVLYDGLRTVDGAYQLYCFASDADLAAGLLALPGQSAHNKGLAVDSMMIDANGHEIDMGGHFDHLDMSTNGRTYRGAAISPAAQTHRMIREAAFLRAAFAQDLLVAPLRNEFWDDRLPENHADLWRITDSAARCIGLHLFTPEDEALRRENRTAFAAKWESWNYIDFLTHWQQFFAGQEEKLQTAIGTHLPPAQERPEHYHGNFHPIYDADLRTSGKHLTDAILVSI